MPRPSTKGDRNFKEIKNKLLKNLKKRQDPTVIQEM